LIDYKKINKKNRVIKEKLKNIRKSIEFLEVKKFEQFIRTKFEDAEKNLKKSTKFDKNKNDLEQMIKKFKSTKKRLLEEFIKKIYFINYGKRREIEFCNILFDYNKPRRFYIFPFMDKRKIYYDINIELKYMYQGFFRKKTRFENKINIDKTTILKYNIKNAKKLTGLNDLSTIYKEYDFILENDNKKYMLIEFTTTSAKTYEEGKNILKLFKLEQQLNYLNIDKFKELKSVILFQEGGEINIDNFNHLLITHTGVFVLLNYLIEKEIFKLIVNYKELKEKLDEFQRKN